MGILRGKKKCLEALRVTGVVAASTGTHTHTYTHGGSWPALGKQDLVLAGNPEDPGAAPKTWQLQKPLEVDTQCPWGLASVHEIRPRFPSLLAHTVKNLPAGNTGLIPGLGRSYGEGAGNPLQYFCLENSMDRGWGHGVMGSQSWTRLRDEHNNRLPLHPVTLGVRPHPEVFHGGRDTAEGGVLKWTPGNQGKVCSPCQPPVLSCKWKWEGVTWSMWPAQEESLPGKMAQEDHSKGSSKLASPLGFLLVPQAPSVSCEEIGRSCFHGTRTKHYERRRERKGGQKDSENKRGVSMVCVFVGCVVWT